MNNIIETKLITFIEKYNIQNSSILISVSGGIDSMVLLNCLADLRMKYALHLKVIHFDHGLRPESADESILVQNECSKLDIPCFFEALHVQNKMFENKISLEMASHELRYEQYDIYVKKYNFDYIATAHHRDDLVETMLMKLAKSAGRESIQGLSEFRPPYIKPFYKVSKSEIKSYQKSNQISYLEDQSNYDVSIERNFWRNEIIPVLRGYYSEGFHTGILNTINHINWTKNDYAIFNDLTQTIQFKDNSALIEISVLIRQFSELQKRLIDFMVTQVAKTKLSLNESQFSSFVDILFATSGKKIVIEPGIEISKQFDKIYVNRILNRPAIFTVLPLNTPIKVNEIKITASIQTEFIQSDKSSIEFIDFDKVKGNLHIKSIDVGEQFYPLGLNGKQKVNRYLKNKKVNKIDREKCIGLYDDNAIVWIIGYGINDRYKITNKTNKFLKLEYI